MTGDEAESHFQMRVLTLARVLGWRDYHTRDSQGSAPGFPDLVLLRPPRQVVAELKSQHGQLTRHQRTWLDAFRACGVEAYEWRPSHFDDIKRILGAVE